MGEMLDGIIVVWVQVDVIVLSESAAGLDPQDLLYIAHQYTNFWP